MNHFHTSMENILCQTYKTLVKQGQKFQCGQKVLIRYKGGYSFSEIAQIIRCSANGILNEWLLCTKFQQQEHNHFGLFIQRKSQQHWLLNVEDLICKFHAPCLDRETEIFRVNRQYLPLFTFFNTLKY